MRSSIFATHSSLAICLYVLKFPVNKVILLVVDQKLGNLGSLSYSTLDLPSAFLLLGILVRVTEYALLVFMLVNNLLRFFFERKSAFSFWLSSQP